MEDVTLLRDENNSLYQKILFERPISRLQARKIGLLAGKHARLKKINDIHQIIQTMNHDSVIIAESELKSVGVPAEVYLQAGKKVSDPFSNSDEAILALGECSYGVVGMDIEIGSRLQIFLEKCITSRKAPVVFTTESVGLFKISPQLVDNRIGDLYICSTQSLIELAKYFHLPLPFKTDAGIYNKIGLLKELAEYLQAHIICIESYQILACSYTDTTKAAVININNPKHIPIDYVYTALLLGLLCDVADANQDILPRILTAGYLLRKSLTDAAGFIPSLKNALTQ